MRFLIYGAGSLGMLYAYYLSKNHHVDLLTRPKRAHIINEHGITLIGDGKSDKRYVNTIEDLKEVQDRPELVIVATKSFDIPEVLKDIRLNFGDIDILTIQNGVFAEEFASELFPKEHLFGAVVMIGSKTINDHTIEQFMDSGMAIGALSDKKKPIKKAKEIVENLKNSSIDARFVENIMKEKWKKLMFYCAAATLNALTGVLNISDSPLSWMPQLILDEIVKVAKIKELNFDIEKAAKEVCDFINSFKPQSWSASVGEDLRKGKRTEIDYLNGYIVTLAEKYNIPVPLNKTLTSIVKTLEKSNYLKKQ